MKYGESYRTFWIFFLFFLNKSKIKLVQINNTLLLLRKINYENGINKDFINVFY